MNDLTHQTLEETLEERAGALPPPATSGPALIARARRERRRRTALGTMGGVAAAAAAVLVAVLVTPAGPPERPVGPASTPGSSLSSSPSSSQSRDGSLGQERPLSIDEIARINAGHAWATALPEGPPVERDLGYRAWREAGRIVVEIGGRQAKLPRDVRLLALPVRLADGWLFLAQRGWGERPAQRVFHVSEEHGSRLVVGAEAVWQIVAAPGGRRFAVVSADPGADGSLVSRLSIHSTDGTEERRVQLPQWEEPRIATWQGDVITLPAPSGGVTPLRRLDLGTGRWSDVRAPASFGEISAIRVLALPGAMGGDPSRALVAVEEPDGKECLHVLGAAGLIPDSLGCAEQTGSLHATVSPDGRHAIVGDGHYDRVNPDRPARVVDLATLADVEGIPAEVLAVGVRHLYWENDHTLIGQATRVSPVHRSEALFRWDITSSRGEALDWDLAQSPFPPITVGAPDEPAVQPGP
ncbi:hypothetical protein [Intrasporangium sp.]|uniref:hypothetical protein n=1 Tax=Intrasporangium sp. TaxID=1925024 RepID=UPI002939D24A|nr:hypothetical protein [Intrasporangium sp.]MDV3222827.1 hypothetical protein [Intrasporangium sp.]